MLKENLKRFHTSNLPTHLVVLEQKEEITRQRSRCQENKTTNQTHTKKLSSMKTVNKIK